VVADGGWIGVVADGGWIGVVADGGWIGVVAASKKNNIKLFFSCSSIKY